MKKKKDYNTQPVLISKNIHKKLLQEKAQRGMSINQLTNRIIEKGLILNVLDMK